MNKHVLKVSECRLELDILNEFDLSLLPQLISNNDDETRRDEMLDATIDIDCPCQGTRSSLPTPFSS